MAHLWHHHPEGWAVAPLSGDVFLLGSSAESPVEPHAPAAPLPGRAVLWRAVADTGELWLLLAPARAGLWVNGQRIRSGVRVLRDRDELRVPGLGSLFFSTEELPTVATYPGSERAAHCPRCRQELAAGAAAVRCPGCGTWHHESPECNCWSYAETCALCAQPTALDAGYQWRPESIAS